jgi:hypothetical protein
MKNIIKYTLIFVIGLLSLSSCEETESNWDIMTKDYDQNNATYYVQFLNASASYETAIDADGLPTNIVTTVGVALLGAPQASDIQVDLTVDPASTLESNMYTLSANSITIPAGETSGSVTLMAVADEMPEDQTLNLVITMSDNVPAAPSANVLNYSMKRIKFCPWTAADMVGTYTGSDYNGYAGEGADGYKFEVFMLDDTHIEVSGLGQHLYSTIWGEVVTAGDRVVIEVKPNGTLEFENQFLCQTDEVWDYYMGPSGETGKWDGCNMVITIPWIWHWDDGYTDNNLCESVLTKD